MCEKYVVITGTSTGIGYEIARKFIHHGFHVFGSLRDFKDGERLKMS